MTFTDLSGDRGAYHCVAQFLFGLFQVGLTHAYTGDGCLIRCYRIVQVQLAGCVLFVKRADTLQVTFGFLCLCFIFLQLGAYFVCFGAILVLVDDEQYLIPLD